MMFSLLHLTIQYQRGEGGIKDLALLSSLFTWLRILILMMWIVQDKCKIFETHKGRSIFFAHSAIPEIRFCIHSAWPFFKSQWCHMACGLPHFSILQRLVPDERISPYYCPRIIKFSLSMFKFTELLNSRVFPVSRSEGISSISLIT